MTLQSEVHVLSFVCLFVCSFVRSFVRSFVHSFRLCLSLVPEGGPVCVMLSPQFECISEL